MDRMGRSRRHTDCDRSGALVPRNGRRSAAISPLRWLSSPDREVSQMASLNSFLIAGAAAVALLAPTVSDAASASGGRILVAEAAADAVTAAERAVADARAQLRKAMASGQGLKEAR